MAAEIVSRETETRPCFWCRKQFPPETLHTVHEEGCGYEEHGCSCSDEACDNCCPTCLAEKGIEFLPLTEDGEKEMLAWAIEHLGGNPTPRQILDFARAWEEIADSHDCPVRYQEAGVLWRAGFERLEREEGAQAVERMAAAFCISTPTAREARSYR